MLAARDCAKAGEECPAGRWRFEMICGTVIFEDQAIQWQLLENRVVRYTVQDSFKGNSETVECTWEGFGCAMALAIASDEVVAATSLYAMAEPAMPKDKELRWIP